MDDKVKELLEAARGNEGDMVWAFESNSYTGEIPQGNEAKRIELIRLALALLSAEQPDAGSFVQRFRKFINLSEEHLSKNKIGRLRTYGKEACGLLAAAEQKAKKFEIGENLYREYYKSHVATINNLQAKVAEQAEELSKQEYETNLYKDAVADDRRKLEATIAEQRKRIEGLEHRIDELTAIRISLETQYDQQAERIEELEKLLEAYGKGSVEVYQRGFDDGKKIAVEGCKKVIDQALKGGSGGSE